ncbi:hypothetical protein VTN00DRAFT_4378 [Thermoascus crustaceus]|uniref:uncharacterized protein n=1 Tax=Thermoascus crustaceus TaxID=5088 RepID=UPI003743E404
MHHRMESTIEMSNVECQPSQSLQIKDRDNGQGEPAATEKPSDDGYPKLARLMASYPETAIFRRFGELNMINILRLQAELQDMECQLQEIRNEDAQSNDPIRQSYVKDFRLMRDWVENGDSLQHELLVSIGEKLREYNLAVSQAIELNRVAKPTRRELDFLRKWLITPSMGNDFLTDVERTIWEPSNDQDFITLLSREQQIDTLSSFMHDTLLDVYHRTLGHRRKQSNSPFPRTGFRSYGESRLATVSDAIAAAFSSLLPALTILILYLIKPMYARIALVIGFTALFSFAFAIFTSARRVEIFAATAAFAAVEVVFVGSVSNG